MKILQVINSLSSGGAEKLVLETSKYYIEQGHEVGILLLWPSPGPYLDEVLAIEEIRLFHLPEGTNIYNPSCLFKISRIKELKTYDVVHVHLFPSFYWMGLLKPFFLNAVLIYTEHNTTNKRRGNPIFRFIDNLIYRRYNSYVAISEAVKLSLLDHIWKSDKLVTIYNGINLDTIDQAKPYTKNELGFTDSDVLLLQVASFTPQKNQNTLIESLKLLPDNVHVLLAGEGPLIEDCKEFASLSGVVERVHFLGVRSDIPRLLKSVDIVILSSHFEGLSLASVEGLASGKPFIASDVPGLTEVVANAGILFPDNDYKVLAAEIEKLTTDSEYNLRITQQCIKRSRKFDIKNMCTQYLNLYQGHLN